MVARGRAVAASRSSLRDRDPDSGECGLKWWYSMLSSSLSCRGGVGRGSDGATAFFSRCWPLPTRCYFDELNHAEGIHASAIFYRHGDASSTSVSEAYLRSCCWSSTLSSHQLVRPRWLGGGQWRRIIAGRGCSSTSPLILGGDSLRTSANCGGDTPRSDCFSLFLSRVFS